jgi:hypothetical protein
VQAGRFNTEDDVLHYVLDPFPWLLMAVYELYHAQQTHFQTENPGADSAASWLSQLMVSSTSTTSGQSSAEVPVKRADSDAEPTKPNKTKATKKVFTSSGTTSTDGETNKLQDKIKQLEKANEKMKKTVGNMKKLSASNKKAQQEVAALKAILAQGGDQTNVQGSLVPAPHTKRESKPKTKSTEHSDQEPAPEKDSKSEQLGSIQLTTKDSKNVSPVIRP